jgi:L-lactate dehydrogenase complex protein LldG
MVGGKDSKKRILDKLGDINPPSIDPYYLYSYVKHSRYDNKLEKFVDSAKKAGARVFFRKASNLQMIFNDAKIIIDTTQNSRVSFNNIQDISLTIIKAEFGVAENGALWIEWNDKLFPRALLTISQYLAIYLEKRKILNNMAEAYDKIDFSNLSYGVFLSGPSKTADIEQSLVIGAHGAVDLAIFLI